MVLVWAAAAAGLLLVLAWAAAAGLLLLVLILNLSHCWLVIRAVNLTGVSSYKVNKYCKQYRPVPRERFTQDICQNAKNGSLDEFGEASSMQILLIN